jgi:hypothetical protein
MADEKATPETVTPPTTERPPLTPPAPVVAATSATKVKSTKTELRSYTVIYDGSITHNGLEYGRGSTIELSEEDAKNLLLRRAIAG